MQITDGYSLFFHCWPWMGMGAAIVLLILTFSTNTLRSDPNKPRWKDPSFVAWIGIDIVLAYVGILTGAVMQFLFIASGTALTGWLYWWVAKNAKPNTVTEA